MFKISTDASVVTENSGGTSNFIGQSGVYDVTINFASIAVSKRGAEQVVFNVNYKGNDQTIYGPYYKDTSGKYNDISVKLYNNLGIIAGLRDGDEPTVEPQLHKVGKDQKEVELDVITDFTDLPIKLQVQAEYSMYEGNIQERFNILGFFSEDGATAEEILNGGEIGKRLAIVEENYASNVSYRGDVTEEMVKEWQALKRSGKKAAAKTPTAKTTAKAGSIFAKKK